MKRFFCAVAMLLAPLSARAHDTFLLAPETPTPAGRAVTLSLSSSAVFPTLDYAPEPARIASTRASSGTLIVRARGVAATELRLASAAPGLQAAGLSLAPFTLTLPPAEVAHYLDEIGASPALKAAAAADPAFRETYVKHVKALVCIARCSLSPGSAAPLGAALEFVTEPRLRRFVLLHQGRPLGGQPVALQSAGTERTLVTTDAGGGVDLPAAARGRTMLSAVRLLPPARPGAPWTSDFATLTFVAGR